MLRDNKKLFAFFDNNFQYNIFKQTKTVDFGSSKKTCDSHYPYVIDLIAENLVSKEDGKKFRYLKTSFDVYSLQTSTDGVNTVEVEQIHPKEFLFSFELKDQSKKIASHSDIETVEGLIEKYAELIDVEKTDLTYETDIVVDGITVYANVKVDCIYSASLTTAVSFFKARINDYFRVIPEDCFVHVNKNGMRVFYVACKNPYNNMNPMYVGLVSETVSVENENGETVDAVDYKIYEIIFPEGTTFVELNEDIYEQFSGSGDNFVESFAGKIEQYNGDLLLNFEHAIIVY